MQEQWHQFGVHSDGRCRVCGDFTKRVRRLPDGLEGKAILVIVCQTCDGRKATQ